MNRRHTRTVRNATILIDLVLINLSFLLAYLARYELAWLRPPEFFLPFGDYLSQQLLYTALVIVTFAQNGVWSRRRGELWLEEMSRIVFAIGSAVGILVVITFFVRPLAFSRLLLFWLIIFSVLSLAVARLARRIILAALYRRGILADRTLIVGTGEVSRGLIRTLLARPDLGFKAIGFLDDGNEAERIGSERIPRLGSWAELSTVLNDDPNISTVFLALPSDMHAELSNLLRVCRLFQVRIQVVPDLLQLSLNQVAFSNMAGLPMLGVRDVRISHRQQAAKRLLDLSIVIIAAVPALLLAGIIGLAIKLDSEGPVIFAQERLAVNGKPFRMLKFRSMVADAESRRAALEGLNEASGPIFKIRQDPRLTRVGRIIRRLSLDELPQLYNVLVGQMSLVGPRPPLAEEVARYQPWHRQRLVVRGGITGLWQVSGRSDLTFDEQCLLDIYYIENWSIFMDLRILLATIPFTLFGRGAY